MGKLALRGLVLLVVISVLGVGSYAIAGGGTKNFQGNLNGWQENPDISTVATGSFEARLSQDGNSLSYELRYSKLEGGPASAAHVHLAKRGSTAASRSSFAEAEASRRAPRGRRLKLS